MSNDPTTEKHDEYEGLTGAIRALVERLRWLEECPFSEGQCFHETAVRELEYWQEEALNVVTAFEDADIEESARSLIEDGADFGDATEADLWEGIAEQIEAKEKERLDFVHAEMAAGRYSPPTD
jgi:hypothetical protein